MLEKQFGTNGNGMGREQEKGVLKGGSCAPPQARVPSQCETGSPGREGGRKAAARTGKTCSHHPGIHITHTGLKQVMFALVSRQRWPNCLKTVFSPA